MKQYLYIKYRHSYGVENFVTLEIWITESILKLITVYLHFKHDISKNKNSNNNYLDIRKPKLKIGT